MTMGGAPLPAPDDSGPDWAGLRDQSAGLLAGTWELLERYDPVALEATAGRCSPELARRVSLLTRALREDRQAHADHAAQLARVTYEDRLATAASREALAAAFEAGRAAGLAEAPGRHRRQRQAAPWLRLAGGALAAGLAAGRVAAARAWAHKLVVTGVLTAVTIPAVTTAQIPGLPAVISSAPAPAAAGHAADVSPVGARPIQAGTPAAGGLQAGPLARKSKRIIPDPDPPFASLATPRPVPPATAPPAGVPLLDVLTPGPVTLQPGPDGNLHGDILFQAAGTPVTWTAGGCAPIAASYADAGILDAGQVADLGLTVPAGVFPGTCTVTITPAGGTGQRVTVTWDS